MEPSIEGVSLCEIGIHYGGSILLWSKYFKRYTIVGVDRNDSWAREYSFQKDIENNPSIHLYFHTDSTKPPPFDCFKFDFIIDDGAHEEDAQLKTFHQYWPYLKSNGVYFIEDMLFKNQAINLKQHIKNNYSDVQSVDIYRGPMRYDEMCMIKKT